MSNLTTQCGGVGSPTVNTMDSYCEVPYSHPGMSTCCAQLGNSSIQYNRGCIDYPWCNLTAVHASSAIDLDSTFHRCLQAFNSSASISGMLCTVMGAVNGTATNASSTSMNGSTTSTSPSASSTRSAGTVSGFKSSLLVGGLLVSAAVLGLA